MMADNKGNRMSKRRSFFIALLVMTVFGIYALRLFQIQIVEGEAYNELATRKMETKISIAASRGIGKSVGPTVIVILGSCVFRVIWVYTVFAWLGTITSLYLLYIFSWTITGAAEIVYFRRSYKKVILSAQSW